MADSIEELVEMSESDWGDDRSDDGEGDLDGCIVVAERGVWGGIDKGDALRGRVST